MSSDAVDEMTQVMRNLWDEAFAAGRRYEQQKAIHRIRDIREHLELMVNQTGGMQ